MMRTILAALIALPGLALAFPADAQTDLGNLSANRLDPRSTSNPLGAGSPLRENGINNPLGVYGSPLSNKSVSNPHATQAPRLYDGAGNYRGRLSANRFDPDSTSNPLGRYGSPLSPESINNPLGAGSPLRNDSPNNPLGTGWTIEGE
jgi:hypothetical protein